MLFRYWAAATALTASVAARLDARKLVSGSTLLTGGPAPIIDLGFAQFKGKNDDRTQTSNYLGITYAKARRFDHAYLFEEPQSGIQDASDYGPACPQHELVSEFSPSDLGLGRIAGLIEALPIFQNILKQSEDCLSINVQRPKDQSLKDLPVLVWIHGGGFEAGSSSSLLSETSAIPGAFYQGANIVKRSIEMGQPVIFTSINYRLAHFGFTASREFDKAGLLNLGFEDQRVALQWIQKYIAKFGGDPRKVTIMGESAGSWSVSGHLVANNGDNEGLFRGAIGMSGGPLKVDGPERQQNTFDSLVAFVGCQSAQNKIACLRDAPYKKIYQHQQTINYFFGFRSLASAWTLRPDGKFFKQSPDKLAAAGQIANVPVLYGDMRDEGTLFSLINQLNLTTTEDVKDYYKTYWWPAATDEQLNRLLELYPQDPTKGSPYGTGLLYSIPLQYKRLASITGDYSFQSQRRAFLGNITAPKWNYLTDATVPLGAIGNSIFDSIFGSFGITSIPIVGSLHSFDSTFYLFGNLPDTISANTRHFMGVIISFANNLDPNKHGMGDLPNWPQWDSDQRKTMNFREEGAQIIADDYREGPMSYMNEIGDSLRI